MKRFLLVVLVLGCVGWSWGEIIDWTGLKSTSPDSWEWLQPKGVKIENYLVLVWPDTFFISPPIAYKEQIVTRYSLKDPGQSVLLVSGELIDFAGKAAISVVAKLSDGTLSNESPRVWAKLDGKEPRVLPTQFVLLQNYPNPFNGVTTIIYDVPEDSFVRLTIFNAGGQLVDTLVIGEKPAGRYRVFWRANNVSSGAYFYRLETESFTRTKKMILSK